MPPRKGRCYACGPVTYLVALTPRALAPILPYNSWSLTAFRVYIFDMTRIKLLGVLVEPNTWKCSSNPPATMLFFCYGGLIVVRTATINSYREPKVAALSTEHVFQTSGFWSFDTTLSHGGLKAR